MKIDVEKNSTVNGHRIFLIDPDVVSRSAVYYMIADTNETYELDSVADLADMSTRLVPELVIVSALVVAKHGKALLQGWRIAWPGVKVLVICEDCDNDCVVAAKAAGADDTLQRPFKLEAVRQKVERWAEGAGSRIEVGIPPLRQDGGLAIRH
jgi:DNA-binding NtrC family response regulator